MDSAKKGITPTPAGKFGRFLRDFLGVPKPELVVDYGRYQCACHQEMGNDFWELPLDKCHMQGGCDYRSKPFKRRAL
jgi:hypothetical protein